MLQPLVKPSCMWLCRVDLVLVGAEGVVENGGVINKLGTYNIAIAAKAHNIPFYVASESYKVSTVAVAVPVSVYLHSSAPSKT